MGRAAACCARARTVCSRAMKHAAALAWMLTLAAALGGCRVPAAPSAGDGPEPRAWHPRPVSLRVYPSTRIVMQDDEPLLEARLELTDEMGDPLKAPGDFRLELYSPDGSRQLYTWRVQALSLQQQRAFYDPITRAYLMRLKLDADALTEGSPRLRVAFITAEGERLQSEAVVRK